MSYSLKIHEPITCFTTLTDSDNGRTGYREARLTAWSVRVPPSLEFASPRVLLSSVPVLSLSICFWRAESTLGFIFLSACLFEILLPPRSTWIHPLVRSSINAPTTVLLYRCRNRIAGNVAPSRSHQSPRLRSSFNGDPSALIRFVSVSAVHHGLLRQTSTR
jgi:hypothetical protein